MRVAQWAPHTPRLDRGWGFGWGLTAPESRVTRYSLANHVVGGARR
jgi:hypothetical protein